MIKKSLNLSITSVRKGSTLYPKETMKKRFRLSLWRKKPTKFTGKATKKSSSRNNKRNGKFPLYHLVCVPSSMFLAFCNVIYLLLYLIYTVMNEALSLISFLKSQAGHAHSGLYGGC